MSEIIMDRKVRRRLLCKDVNAGTRGKLVLGIVLVFIGAMGMLFAITQ
ncbi:Uncharacterised protein [Yersinia frederiksenii]|uniref:Uncharacterized protein n=2 Tax=Yersinia frederiksenii TaxID=29484 RepID=A0A380PZA3_YERFR|nr:hypothetical protein [Yersinia frederiksenii]KGA46831.1 hypothetical protein DJ58_1790 [Yersinia frederiksenii ATCC 33641]MDN0120346.1 hypothetical protein [Yersinia frederiksenii]CFR12847.1 Uncharacterised protein [Yersinia frederiksenii]CNB99577.1 Uncharacterised protein [Yersinia frederiksenii]CNG22747.1 Uncharacterised protein [Yersinia frederiksenii]